MTTPSPRDVADDLLAMLIAWNSGSDEQRSLALEMAERNRQSALTPPAPKPKKTP